MAKYRKKPVVIEAIQWNGENLKEVIEFTGKHPNWDKWFSSFDEYENYVKNDGSIFKIFTLEGTMEAGDIVETVGGWDNVIYYNYDAKNCMDYRDIVEAAFKEATASLDSLAESLGVSKPYVILKNIEK